MVRAVNGNNKKWETAICRGLSKMLKVILGSEI